MSRVHEALRKSEVIFRKNASNRASDPEPPKEEKSRTEFMAAEVLTDLSVRPAFTSHKDVSRPLEPLENENHLPVCEPKLSEKIVVFSNPRSIVAERFRALRTKLFQMRNQNKRLKTILVTSAAPAEGKTLTSLNLSLAIAQEIDQNVLLIDSDLRRPSVHKTIGVPNGRGLSEFLRSEAPSNEFIQETTIPNFFLVPAGGIAEKPTELLNTHRMKSFLATAADRFDWVILDSPPFVSLADSEILSSLVDGVLIVVRARQTPADVIAKSKDFARGKNILGIIFNGVEDSKGAQYYYYYDQRQGEQLS
ncbi:MAG: CpsD/CapB family tyrosine-protein kinase [Terriglobia bacterium]